MINKASGNCLDVSGSSGHGYMKAWPCNRKDKDVIWEYMLDGELRNALSGKCMDVAGSNGHGNVNTWDCLNGLDQKWQLGKFDEEYFSFINKKSG